MNAIQSLVSNLGSVAKRHIKNYLMLLFLLTAVEIASAWIMYSNIQFDPDAQPYLYLIIFVGALFFSLYIISTKIALTGAGLATEISKYFLHEFMTTPLAHGKRYEEVSVRVIDYANRLNEGVLIPALQLVGRCFSSLILLGLLFVIDLRVFVVFCSSILVFYTINFLTARRLINKFGGQAAIELQKRFTLLSKTHAVATEVFYSGSDDATVNSFQISTKRFYEARAKLQVLPLVPRFFIDALLVGIALVNLPSAMENLTLTSIGALVMVRLLSNLQMIYGYVSSIKAEHLVVKELSKFQNELLMLKSKSLKHYKPVHARPNGAVTSDSLLRQMEAVAKESNLSLLETEQSDKKSRLVMLGGANGVGKSTFLLKLAALMAGQSRIYYQSSYVCTFGETFEDMKKWRFAAPNQTSENTERLSFAEKVCFDHKFRSLLTESRKAGPRKYSSGQLQRIQIYRALSSTADVYLLDEPTSALDPENISNLFEGLNSYSQRFDCYFIIVDHSVVQGESRRFVVERIKSAGNT